MSLSPKQILFIQHYFTHGEQDAGEAWMHAFPHITKRTSANPLASRFLKRADAQDLLTRLRDMQNGAIVKATEASIASMYAEKVASDMELDMFLTSVVRGECEVEEIFSVKEMGVQEWTDEKGLKHSEAIQRTVFKKIKRAANINERTRAATQLFLRRGSYARNMQSLPNPDDQVNAAKAKGATSVKRYILLSNGNKIELEN